MTDLTPIKQALSAGPTPGKWIATHNEFYWSIECDNGSPSKYQGVADLVNSTCMVADDGSEHDHGEANAAFIAACHPQAISDLIASYEQLEAEIAALKAERDTLREALKPFARIADMEKSAGPNDSVMVNVSRCRDARSALSTGQEEGNG